MTPVYSPSPEYIQTTLANLAGRPAFAADLPEAVQPVPNGSGLQQRQQPTRLTCSVAIAARIADGSDLPGHVPGHPALPGTEYIISGRVDLKCLDKDQAFWRVRMDHGTQATYADPINTAFSAASYQPAYDGQGQWTHVFSPNATNQFIYAGSYYRAIFTRLTRASSRLRSTRTASI